MDYKTLVVQAEADDDGRSRVQLALALAIRFDATLVGTAARALLPLMILPGGSPGTGTLLAAEEGDIRAGLDAAERQFRALAAATHARIGWRSKITDPAEMLALEARTADLCRVSRQGHFCSVCSRVGSCSRTADLIVVGRRPERDDAGWSRHADPGAVLMRAGRPILVVPPGVSSLNTDHIVIAWKDSLEARRAVVDAMPFLTRAASVLVLQVCHDEGERERAAAIVPAVAAYLITHGVTATSEARLLREATVSAELLLAMEHRRAELVVAGGYAHSRLQEWVFGGLTKTLLGHFPKCCLLSR